MSTRKHVNLDMDVHLKLVKQRKQSHLTIKAIANGILRCALSSGRLLQEAIGEILVERGYIDTEEYSDVTQAAYERVRACSIPDDESFVRVAQSIYTAGSWTVKLLHACPEGSHQILEASARDARRRATPIHVHNSTECLVVLSGSVVAHLGDRVQMLKANDSLSIPSGTPHSMTPLTRETVLSVTLVPGSKAFV